MIDSYEVFVLVDEASRLMMRDEAVSGLVGLDIAACRAMAVSLAREAEVVPVEVPGTVASCIAEAARRAAFWDTAGLAPDALRLVLLLSDVNHELNRA